MTELQHEKVWNITDFVGFKDASTVNYASHGIRDVGLITEISHIKYAIALAE